jgi:hypothetical protein
MNNKRKKKTKCRAISPLLMSPPTVSPSLLVWVNYVLPFTAVKFFVLIMCKFIEG